MVNLLDAAVGAGVVGVRGGFVGAEAHVEGARDFGAQLKTAFGKESSRASPERDAAIDEDAGRVRCGELSLSSGERAC